MNEFRESLLVLISVPVYTLVIGAELIVSFIGNKGLYTTRGIVANVYLSTLNMLLDVLMRGACLLVLAFFFPYRVADLSMHPILYWTVLVLAEDFMFYWLHRVDHHCRLFWAVHVTHHSSEEFNLSVGFRSSVLQPLYRFLYFIPLSLFGFRGIDIMFVYSATQIFGILVHTQTIDKLGFLEYFLVTPSHHRVHHGSNPRYLDKNLGMFLIIWDRMFGTFEPEDRSDPVRYGLTTNIRTLNPVRLVFHEWHAILKDIARKDCSPGHKFMYVFGPPGWSHDGSRKTSRQQREAARQGDYETPRYSG
jgi:sterol desaturase/sphingolipid hydroxylase (fatty acid hydroxylase superfamily)